MKPKKTKSTVTNTSLDEIYKKLCISGGAARYRNSKPLCALWFHGTEKEFKEVKRKLIELNPNDPSTS